MTRQAIVRRVNQLMFEGLYTYEQIKHDFDNAIIKVNETLNSKFPLFTEIMTSDNSTYTYYTVSAKDKEPILFYTEEDADHFIINNNTIDYIKSDKLEIIPARYMHTVVINYVVSELFRREDEFGNAYSHATNEYTNSLVNMFRDYFEKVPKYFQDLDTGFININVY